MLWTGEQHWRKNSGNIDSKRCSFFFLFLFAISRVLAFVYDANRVCVCVVPEALENDGRDDDNLQLS